MAERPWWNVAILAVLAVALGAAAFYLYAFTDATGAAGQFFALCAALVGSIAGITVPPLLSSMVNGRAAASSAAVVPLERLSGVDDQHDTGGPPVGMYPPADHADLPRN